MTTPLPKPGTKWRAYREAARIAVYCDGLREAGLYPFPSWRPTITVVAHPLVPEGTAYLLPRLNGWFKEVYGGMAARLEIATRYP